MQNILFRADSSSTIGTGHIMRDLVLAEQFKNANIIFATQGLPGNINHKIKEKNYLIELVSSNNINELIAIIKKHSINIIVIDHYKIDIDYEKSLKNSTGVTIFVLDDTYEKHHCDILLNHNIYAKQSKYKSLVPENCVLKCGAKYTLLREEFKIEKGKKRKSSQEIKNILISMGGTDHLNTSIQVLNALDAIQGIKIDVVTTNANPHLFELKRFIKNKKNTTLHINTHNIAKLMNKADIAIITPSVTANEIFYMKTPFISIKTADNQKEMHNYLVENNYVSLNEFNKKKLFILSISYCTKESKCLKNI